MGLGCARMKGVTASFGYMERWLVRNDLRRYLREGVANLCVVKVGVVYLALLIMWGGRLGVPS